MKQTRYIKPVVAQTVILPQCRMMVGSNDYEENTSETPVHEDGTELRSPRRRQQDIWSWEDEEELMIDN